MGKFTDKILPKLKKQCNIWNEAAESLTAGLSETEKTNGQIELDQTIYAQLADGFGKRSKEARTTCLSDIAEEISNGHHPQLCEKLKMSQFQCISELCDILEMTWDEVRYMIEVLSKFRATEATGTHVEELAKLYANSKDSDSDSDNEIEDKNLVRFKAKTVRKYVADLEAAIVGAELVKKEKKRKRAPEEEKSVTKAKTEANGQITTSDDESEHKSQNSRVEVPEKRDEEKDEEK